MQNSLLDHAFVVGPLPPPVHGASVITQKIVELLQSRGVDVVALNVSPTAATRDWRWHASRIKAYLHCYSALLAAPRRSNVYLALSGGNGLGYDLLVAVVARMKAHRTVMHHHSFNYVDCRNWAFAQLLGIAPPDQVHIVLCDEMRTKIEQRYKRTLHAVTVSNFNFFRDEAKRATPRTKLRRIGFLSNITRDKGIDRFFELSARLAAFGIEAHVAGPIAEPGLQAEFDARLRAHPNVKYLGPLFGDEKHEFYRNIDLFVLPSRYVNEAEPLVIYEAMSAGLPVAVTARGCLCEFAGKPYVVLMDRDAADLGPVIARVEQWVKDPSLFARASSAALEHMDALRAKPAPQLAALVTAIAPEIPGPKAVQIANGYPHRVVG